MNPVFQQSSRPISCQSIDSNVHKLTSHIATIWQQTRAQTLSPVSATADAEDKQMVTAHSLQVGDIILVETRLQENH